MVKHLKLHKCSAPHNPLLEVGMMRVTPINPNDQLFSICLSVARKKNQKIFISHPLFLEKLKNKKNILGFG